MDKIIDLNGVKHKPYNGWSNYETWCANLWLSNDEVTYNKYVSCQNSREIGELIIQIVDYYMNDEASMAHDLVLVAIENINLKELYEKSKDV